MKLEFPRKTKKITAGVRLTNEEFIAIKKIAKLNNSSVSETVSVLMRVTLNKIKT